MVQQFQNHGPGSGNLGALFVTVALVGIYRAHRLKPFQGETEFDEKTGIVVESNPPYAQVKVQGKFGGLIRKKTRFNREIRCESWAGMESHYRLNYNLNIKIKYKE